MVRDRVSVPEQPDAVLISLHVDKDSIVSIARILGIKLRVRGAFMPQCVQGAQCSRAVDDRILANPFVNAHVLLLCSRLSYCAMSALDHICTAAQTIQKTRHTRTFFVYER